MSGGNTVEQIDAVDAFARTLFLRAKETSGPLLDEVSYAVRQLHNAFRYLRVEASEPDSILNNPDEPVFARQLRSLIENCGFHLTQLENTLDLHDKGDDRAEKRMASIHGKLVEEKSEVDMFLDTVQLQNPRKTPVDYPSATQAGLEDIKDKVDRIAHRLFIRRNTSEDNDEDLWQDFRLELEKEGFSPQVLRRHKDILRAYIRELETMSLRNGGATPTVRGLLEEERKYLPAPPEPARDIDSDKFLPSMMAEQRMPHHEPKTLIQTQNFVSGSPPTARDTSPDSPDSMALISTRDLLNTDLTSSMGAMQLHYGAAAYGSSPKDSSSSFTTQAPPFQETIGSPNPQEYGSSPRTGLPPPPYAHAVPAQAPPAYASPRPARLAPDSYGKEIPLDAPWTRIKRTRVSPEVLERAGVRYEARPEYVAVLGRLTKEQIEEYARQSAACRAARAAPPVPRKYDEFYYDRSDSKSSSQEERYNSNSDSFEESDTTDVDDDKTSEKGTRSYPYIVNPPEKDKKVSPTTTSQPKSILKNKNENHVHFGPDPYETEKKDPRNYRDERDRERERDYERDRRRTSQRPRTYDDRDARGGERYASDRDRRRGASDSDYYRRHPRDRDYRERERERERKPEKTSKSKAWKETLGAVGIGGAAVSLLGVLAEASI